MNTPNDLISIIIPIYNVEQYLPRCLDSLICQTYSNLEMILVDDGSTDRSGELIRDYLKKDLRFKAITKENGGLSDARNAGIEAAAGKYLIFVDSDDYVHRRFVELLYHTAISYDADIAVCEGIETDDHMAGDTDSPVGEAARVDVLPPVDAMKFWYRANFRNATVAWNKIYKRELFEQERFPKGKLHEDEFIMHRLYLRCSRIAYLWRRLYFYYQREDSITGAKEYSPRRLDAVDACEARQKDLDKLGDAELIFLHTQRYVDTLLGCSVGMMTNYHGNDKEQYLGILSNKMRDLSKSRRIAPKQFMKLRLFLALPAVYAGIYKRLKG